MSKNHLLEHSVTLEKGTKPIFLPAYQLSHNHWEFAKKLVKDMLREGVSEESKSLWNSLLPFVTNKDGTWHLGVDYCRLKVIMVKDKFPLPIISDLLHS